MPIKLAIVDDKNINRQTVKEKLHLFDEVCVMLEAKDGADFLQKLKEAIAKPDVVLMDLEMPAMGGIEAILLASASYPNIKFIVLTVFEDNQKIFDAIKAGASGYLLKEDSAVNIIDAITNLHEHNGIPMSPAIARKAMEILREIPFYEDKNTIDGEDVHAGNNIGLSKREMEILIQMVGGKNYKSIGEQLFISPLTVRKHAAHIYEKLHVNSRAQAVSIAHKKNWV